MFSTLPVVGSNLSDISPSLDQDMRSSQSMAGDVALSVLPDLCSNPNRDEPAVGGKKKAGISDQPLVVEPFNDLRLLPGLSCNGSEGGQLGYFSIGDRPARGVIPKK